ncbi:hypothetical protein QN360_06720 [Glaciimonas sp. CA11.2]|uniref:hypothetical protein n=1 Tax=Glaciimonas sp. CA11.2 TaxID=3048601 RepID=UPI002AB55359|nr:hypothetical protein [Glaciimonas sp. CA11.2]MDY7545856.1 hypothetical protein [Glaciimonas sp. CA11.2]MEB0162598.1 hypothetical protein [Glaciimonas sp. CA11.2]
MALRLDRWVRWLVVSLGRVLVLGSMFNQNGPDDPIVYPENPTAAPEKFDRIPRSSGRLCPSDNSVWEQDTSSHGGSNGSDGKVKDLGKKVSVPSYFW